MPFNKKLFAQEFISESLENLDLMHEAVSNLNKNILSHEHLSTVLRELHTIKGTSRLLGFSNIERLSNALENLFKGIQEKRYSISANSVKTTYLVSDYIKTCLKNIKENGIEIEDSDVDRKASIDKIVASCEKAFNTDGIVKSVEEDLIKQGEIAVNKSEKIIEDVQSINSIRVKLDDVNNIIQAFDNLIIKQFIIKHKVNVIESREQNLVDSMSENNKTFFRSIKQLYKDLSEDLNQMEKTVFSVQNQIFNLRMLSLNLILLPLKQFIEKESINLNKNINYEIPSSGISVDKVVLEQLADILLHIVRNSIDHGIETEEERIKKGKSPNGKISLSIRQMSGYIVLSVKDDGRGIDYEKVRRKAMELYPERKKEIDVMDNNSLQAFIFLSGFSTKENVSNLSGRGVGLDIVREKMEKIKGRFQLLSKENEGTSFELTVPISLATQQGIIIESAKKRFMFSSQYINEIISVSSGSFQDVGKQIVYNYNGNLISVYYLSALLGENIKSGGNFLILIEYMNKCTGIIVDNVSQYFSVVVKPLPSLFDKLKILQGVIFDENYTMVPVLNVLEVVRKLRKISDYDIKKREVIEDSYEKKYTILIVDDSTTTRAIERFILRGAGYDVVEAVEGVDALEKLKKIKVDLIIADLKMPNMDGKVLFNNLKRIGKYENIPVVIVSSVENKNVQNEILAAGARAYIEKSSFERGTLLQVVKEILAEK